MSDATIDEICIVALAEAFRGDGEVLCNPMGPVPVIAGRLARATFEPDLMLTDTIAYGIEGNLAFGGDSSDAVVESYLPFRSIFDQVWSGKRHVVMGASQIDRHGNQNFAAIGDYRKPKAQLLGMRRTRQPHQPRHHLLGAEPGEGVQRNGRRRLGARVRPHRGAAGGQSGALRDPAGGHRTGGLRLRVRGPHHAGPIAAPGREPRRRPGGIAVPTHDHR
ncbi:MAG: hypothetical protein R2695_02095 [Acidimicrobiales bacterium]